MLENRKDIAEAQRHLGYVALRYGEHATARASFEASLATHAELGYKPGVRGTASAPPGAQSGKPSGACTMPPTIAQTSG